MKYPKKRKAELLVNTWNRCNNRCVFCYNQTLMHLPLNVKEHLEMCNDILTSSFMENFDYLRFLGGELFDGAIEKLDVEAEYWKLMHSALELLRSNEIEKVNFLTNFIYVDNKWLKATLKFFEDNGMIDRVELSTSYDKYGRFTEESEQWWWNNVKWVNETYPKMKIDIGMIMTQPFIISITKEWLDNFYKVIKNVSIYFIELDTAILKRNKQNSPYHQLFPHRHDFIQFLINLKNWDYYDLLVKPDGTDPYNAVDAIQMVYVDEFPFPLFKNQHYLLEQRREFLEDGYCDSSVPLWTDIKRILRM